MAQAIEACVLARIEETELAAVDVARINRWAAVLSFPQLQPTASIVWQAPRPVEGALARITRDAVDLWEWSSPPGSADVPSEVEGSCSWIALPPALPDGDRWRGVGTRPKVKRYRRRFRASSAEPIYGR